jgi:hypothetical protein
MGQRREKLAGRSPSSAAAVEVAGAENRDGAILAVVTRLATYLPAADPDDGLGEHAAACTADFAERNMAEYGQLRSECGHQPGHFGGYLLALGASAGNLCCYLGQLHEIDESRRVRRPIADRADGQFRDPVQYPDGEGPSALRAGSAMRPGLPGRKADPAFPVPVQVVLAFSG